MSNPRPRSIQIAVNFLVTAAVLAVLIATAGPAPAQTLTTLYTFAGPPTDGAIPNGGLIMDSQGNLYGTTENGGNGGPTCGETCGIAFEVSATDSETVLHFFAGPPDGDTPESGLVMNAQGVLYGETGIGGAYGYGEVYQIQNGTEKAIYNFTGGPDGASPEGPLVFDENGNLYGVTGGGGAHGLGTVFKLTPSGAETVLYSFRNGVPSTRADVDGAMPSAGVIFDAEGNLYGTTALGGDYGLGTVFKLTPNGTETVLYSFCSKSHCSDGKYPFSGLVMDAQGNLYGTTYYGGADNVGVVFEVSPRGTETVLHSFGGQGDGQILYGGLVMDANGNLFGATAVGGAYDAGTVFEISAGTETILYNFTGAADGCEGRAPLTIDAQGNLYGVTAFGGGSGCYFGAGTIYKLTR